MQLERKENSSTREQKRGIEQEEKERKKKKTFPTRGHTHNNNNNNNSFIITLEGNRNATSTTSKWGDYWANTRPSSWKFEEKKNAGAKVYNSDGCGPFFPLQQRQKLQTHHYSAGVSVSISSLLFIILTALWENKRKFALFFSHGRTVEKGVPLAPFSPLQKRRRSLRPQSSMLMWHGPVGERKETLRIFSDMSGDPSLFPSNGGGRGGPKKKIHNRPRAMKNRSRRQRRRRRHQFISVRLFVDGVGF